MADESSFYITLPSNTNQYDTNTLNNFRVRLPQRFELSGPDWEVALVEAIYPHSWFNFTCEENNAAEMLITFAVNYDMGNKKFERYSSIMAINIPSDYYHITSQLIDVINEEIKLKSKKEYERLVKYAGENKLGLMLDSVPLFLRFEYDQIHNRTLLHVLEDAIVEKVRLCPILAYMLGFGRSNITIKDKGWEILTNGQITRKADYPPDMKAGLYAIYVYCNIVERQIVGDVLVPLLAKIPVSGEHDSIVHQVFNPPLYVPIVRNSIDTIEISIKDDTNRGIQFQYGKVILTLHFRRRKIRL